MKNKKLFITRLKSGDSLAYEQLMDSFYHKLCTYALTLTNDFTKAEDIVQNVFVKVWILRKNLKTNLDLKPYLYRSVYNEFIDEYRKNRKAIYLEKKHIEAVDLVVENEKLNIDEMMKIVNKEIDNLPPKCKNIFILNKKEGLSHDEISEYLNISVKTIEGHMTRAFKILNEKLSGKLNKVLFLLFSFKDKINKSLG
ncbi:RNA polymerase sigma factor [Flavivirga spongiicola]|uniref:RNA polymerase sigma-70 factor n=1 Tax=Flavivirga spongiicola TaxID=421621 RepID=A0ABU7XST6_9FLAO|nr:RNA polymerase sigma-70 factor [Flavivirga sp. MEBiC05379]MDO5978586.1 RNA polymerase sigma-70 factor [Flavivirga sp. MEBiC05379]